MSNSTIIGLSATKIGIGAAISTILISIVVMIMSHPKSKKETLVALIATAISAICGGAAVIEYFNLQHLITSGSYTGLLSVCGLVFAAGVPGWALVRAIFAYTESNKNRSILTIIKDIKKVWN